MTDAGRLSRARARSDDAKRRLKNTVATLRYRLDPQKVARDAVDGIVDQGTQAIQSGVETAKKNPGPTIGGVALLAAFLSRKRLAGLIWRRKPKAENAAKPAFPPGVHADKSQPTQRRNPK